jgi:membrane protein
MTRVRLAVFVRALFRRLGAIDIVNEAMLFGAGLLVSVVPVLVLLSTFASERVGDHIALHLGLDHRAANIVSHLFANASPAFTFAVVTSVAFAVAGTITVVSSILQVYEKVFEQPHRGNRDLLRVVGCTLVMCAAVGFLTVVDRAVLGTPGGAVFVDAVMFAGVTVFVWWLMHFLLAGRVGWRTLWPSAIATGIFAAALGVSAKLYFSSSIISDDKTYGPIGAVFDLMTWLIAIGAVLVLGAVAGPAWREARTQPETAPQVQLES